MKQEANVIFEFCLHQSSVFLQSNVNKPIEVQQFGAVTADVKETLPVAASSLCSNCGKTCWIKQRHDSSKQDDCTDSQHTSCSQSPGYKHIMWLFWPQIHVDENYGGRGSYFLAHYKLVNCY